MSNYELLRRWKILPVHLLLVQRRVKWLQTLLKDLDSGEQVIAANFGKLEVVAPDWSLSVSSLGENGAS